MTKLKKTYKKKYYGGMNTNQWAAAFTYQINNPGSFVYIKHRTTGEIRHISTNIGLRQRFNIHQLKGEMGDWDIYVKNNGKYYQIGGNSAEFPNLISVDIGLFTNKLVENYFLTKDSLTHVSSSNSPSASALSSSASSSVISKITSTYTAGGHKPLVNAQSHTIHDLVNDITLVNTAVNNVIATYPNTAAAAAASNTAAAAAASPTTDDNARLLLLTRELNQLQGQGNTNFKPIAEQIIKVVSFIIAVIAIGAAIWYKNNAKKGGNPTSFSYEQFFKNPTLHGCVLFFKNLNAQFEKLPISDFKKGGRQNTRKKNKK